MRQTLVEIEGGKESEPVIVRIATIKRNDGGKTVAIGIDNKKKHGLRVRFLKYAGSY